MNKLLVALCALLLCACDSVVERSLKQIPGPGDEFTQVSSETYLPVSAEAVQIFFSFAKTGAVLQVPVSYTLREEHGTKSGWTNGALYITNTYYGVMTKSGQSEPHSFTCKNYTLVVEPVRHIEKGVLCVLSDTVGPYFQGFLLR